MKIVLVAVRSLNDCVSHHFHKTHLLRNLSTWRFTDSGTVNQQANKSESPDEFEKRIFGEIPGTNSQMNFLDGDRTDRMADLEGMYDTLSDGMDGKLKNAATFFEFDEEEIEKEDYSFRYDANFPPFTTYDTKALDLTKPGVRKPAKWNEFEVTTKEVLSQADFRNVRFLANFITEAGILIKRSKTGISAKAQRKVAREIKTARAFGLMPFTTMGTKSFVYGKTMENLDNDYAYRRSNTTNVDGELGMEGDEAKTGT